MLACPSIFGSTGPASVQSFRCNHVISTNGSCFRHVYAPVVRAPRFLRPSTVLMLTATQAARHSSGACVAVLMESLLTSAGSVRSLPAPPLRCRGLLLTLLADIGLHCV